MKEWYELKNYRKKYERFYGEKLPDGYEVHHLDLDRVNNSINNLIAIPKDVHRAYHETMIKLEFSIVSGNTNSFKDIFSVCMASGAPNMNPELINQMIKATIYIEHYVCENQFKFYRSLSRWSNELGISEIIVREM